jgi:beta-glucanase (GH16 family)
LFLGWFWSGRKPASFDRLKEAVNPMPTEEESSISQKPVANPPTNQIKQTKQTRSLAGRAPSWLNRHRILSAALVGLGLAGAALAVFLIWLKPTSPAFSPAQPAERPGWKLAWSDEFNGPAGTPPDPAVWGYDIGDGTANGNRGWGNNELEYYTDSPDNAALDGAGNLVLTARKAETASNLRCYYGPCQYTSARLLTANKVEFTYGRIEIRVKVPRGNGLWPAFWALGTNINKVGWPKSGEIDIMENIGRQPRRIFGTIHGPGYSGNAGFTKSLNLPHDVADDFHVFAIERQPDKIVWYIDDVVYNQATPADVAPDQWVFNQPFFLLLNVAVGGNLGGIVGLDTTFPQTMTVDYVRHYQKAT